MNKTRTILFVALSLLLIRLSTSVILWHLNAHSTDDWNFLGHINYMFETGDVAQSSDGRVLSKTTWIITTSLFPDRFQAFEWVHILQVWLTSVGFFYLLWRLFPNYGWVSMLAAVTYLTYIPVDRNSQISWLIQGTWFSMCGMFSLVLLLEYYKEARRRRYIWVGLSCLLGFTATASFEGVFILMCLIPLLMIYLEKQSIRAVFVGTGAWYGATGMGFALFVIPYLTGGTGANHQLAYQKPGLDLPRLFEDTITYYRRALPLTDFVPSYHLILPAMIASLLFLMVSWYFMRQYPEQMQLPPTRFLAMMMLVGMVLIPLGGSGHIYADLVGTFRSLFYSLFGQALVVTGVICLLAWFIEHTLRVKFVTILIYTLFIFTSTQWFYASQIRWGKLPNFDDKTSYMRELVALLPNLEEGTLLLLDGCETINYTPYFAGYRMKYMGYLYGEPSKYGYTHNIVSNVTFRDDVIIVPNRFNYVNWDIHSYPYESLVIVACEETGLRVVQHLADHPEYNPYARIYDGFLPTRRTLILER